MNKMKLIIITILSLFLALGSQAWATVSSSTTKTAYTCNGTSTTYAYPFRILEDNDIKVIVSASDGSLSSTLALNTDYTVTGAGGLAGGNIVLTAGSKCANTKRLTLLRNIDLLQGTDYVDGDAFSADTLETPLDKGILIDQQQNEEIRRAPKFPESSPYSDYVLPTPTAGKLLGWGQTDATKIENYSATINTAEFDSTVVNIISDLRLLTPTNNASAHLLGYYTPGDTDMPLYRGVTGAGPGTYVDNGGSIIVPTGGDGSAAWLWVWSGAISPAFFGASPSQTAAVNTAAMLASIAVIPATGGSWVLPDGTYTTNAVLPFANFSGATIDFVGWLKNDTSSALKFTEITNSDIRGIKITRTARNWSDDHKGILLDRYFTGNKISINHVFGFKKGLHVDANDTGGANLGIGWNEFYLGKFQDNEHGLHISESGNGWTNDNTWHGGSFRLYVATKAATSGSWGVYFDSVVTWVYSNHRFIGTAFELLHNGMKIDPGCYNFSLYKPRFESTDLWVQMGATIALTWDVGYGPYDEAKVTMTAGTRGLAILGVHSSGSTNYRSMAMDEKWGGITIFNPLSPATTRSQIWQDSVNYPNLRVSSYLNATQNQTKQFEGSAAPTTGTYAQNSVVWNTNVASGQAMFWTSTRAGTLGTLNGGATTGDMTIGTPTLTVSTATGLLIGQWLSVAGAITGATVINIQGTTVTLSANASATVSGAAVSFYTTFWVAGPAYP